MKTIRVTAQQLTLLQDAVDDSIGISRPSDELLVLQVELHHLTGESFPPIHKRAQALRRNLVRSRRRATA